MSTVSNDYSTTSKTVCVITELVLEEEVVVVCGRRRQHTREIVS